MNADREGRRASRTCYFPRYSLTYNKMKVNNKNAIINRLRKSKTPISGEELSKELKISRTAIWKNINQLKNEGYTINSSHLGYLLDKKDDLLLPYEFQEDSDLYIYKQSTESTIDIAKNLILKGRVKNWQIVVTEMQHSGRSKGTKKFLSPIGGLYFTVILFPNIPFMNINLIPMAGLLAVSDSIKEILGINTKLRWPFEVWNNDKKISGILHEYSFNGRRCEWLTLGIGVNLGVEIPRRKLLESIRRKLKDSLLNIDTILDRYKDELNLKNRHCLFNIEGESKTGIVDNIDRLGTLTVINQNSKEFCYIGDSYIKEIT